MAQYIAFRSDIELLGQSALSAFAAMGPYAALAHEILAMVGVGEVTATCWIPQQPYLDAYKAIADRVGVHTLVAIGKKVPEFAVWPPEIDDIESGLRSIDVAYHMNHRRSGEVMFDPATGEMLDGIGHYGVEHVGKRRIVMVCDTPYPSEFDRGIILGVGRRFEPTVEVEVDPSRPSRSQGADACTYLVTW